jgi:hypothetical protein
MLLRRSGFGSWFSVEVWRLLEFYGEFLEVFGGFWRVFGGFLEVFGGF